MACLLSFGIRERYVRIRLYRAAAVVHGSVYIRSGQLRVAQGAEQKDNKQQHCNENSRLPYRIDKSAFIDSGFNTNSCSTEIHDISPRMNSQKILY